MAVVLKEGFLLKRDGSFMFPGWKKKYCSLKSDGLFTIGDGKHVETKFNTKIDMKSIEQGFEAESLNLPKHRSDMESMFVVHLKHKKHYLLSGNSGECLAWIGSIKNSQTRTNSGVAPAAHHAPTPQPPYIPQYPAGGPPQQQPQGKYTGYAQGNHPQGGGHSQLPYNPNFRQ